MCVGVNGLYGVCWCRRLVDCVVSKVCVGVEGL